MFNIYSKSTCPKCVEMKKYFEENSLMFEEISLDNPDNLKEFKEQFSHVRSLPFVVFTGIHQKKSYIGRYFYNLNDIKNNLERIKEYQ